MFAPTEMTSNAYAFAVESDSTHQPEDQDNDENRAEYAAADVHVDLLWSPYDVIRACRPPARLRVSVHRGGVGVRTTGTLFASLAKNATMFHRCVGRIAIVWLASRHARSDRSTIRTLFMSNPTRQCSRRRSGAHTSISLIETGPVAGCDGSFGFTRTHSGCSGTFRYTNDFHYCISGSPRDRCLCCPLSKDTGRSLAFLEAAPLGDAGLQVSRPSSS